MNDIKVSICCLVYNHSKYLDKCIEGFLNQKTNFEYEILIHDDASTDNSQSIIKSYEIKYPNKIKAIYQTENQHKLGVKISKSILYPITRGKYIAKCEGDDFWIDENKLQKQYDVMELNENCTLAVHKTMKVNVDGVAINSLVTPKTQYYDNIINGDDFIYNFFMNDDSYPFHTSSYFARREVLLEMPELKFGVGDIPCLLWSAYKGDIYFIKEIFSCYRVNVKNSYNHSLSKNKKFAIKKLYQNIEGINEFDKCTNQKYSKIIRDRVQYLMLQYYYAAKVKVDGFDLKEAKKNLSKKQILKAYFKFTIIGNLFRRINLYRNQNGVKK